MPVKKRSITISGHATSFSLEDEFWDGLKTLADADGLAVATLVRKIDAERPRNSNLSSALRLYVLQAARQGHLPLLCIKQIDAADTVSLRRSVLWPQKTEAELMLGEDKSALHLGAYWNGHLVGVASFFPDNASVRLRKLAIRAEYQGRGIGKSILQTAKEKLSKRGNTVLWCDARVSALPFYQKLGFTAYGDEFDKQGVAYIKARTILDVDQDLT